MKTIRKFCPKYNKNVILTFSTINNSTLNNNSSMLGLMLNCSNCKLNICSDCPFIK
jgi:hypothetical protein